MSLLAWAPPTRRRQYNGRNSNMPWTPAEDRRLMRAITKMLSKPREKWQGPPAIDWVKIARRHGRSCLAVQARVTLLRAAARLARGIADV